MLHAGLRRGYSASGVLLAVALALSSWNALAAGANDQRRVAQVTHLSGALVAKHADGTVQYLSVASGVNEGDVLATQEGAYARVKFADGAQVVLRPASRLKVASYRFAEDAPGRDDVELGLLKGGMRAVSGTIARRSSERVKVVVSGATIGMRSAHFGILFCSGDCSAIRRPGDVPPKDGLHLDVAAGAVTVSNRAGTQRVNAGQFAYAPPGASAAPVIVPPGQGIQVTMPSAIARNATADSAAGQQHSSDGCATQ
jgi:hypothetical protein